MTVTLAERLAAHTALERKIKTQLMTMQIGTSIEWHGHTVTRVDLAAWAMDCLPSLTADRAASRCAVLERLAR